MSEDMMAFNTEGTDGEGQEDGEQGYEERTYTVRCDHCEREVIHASDTGEPILSESCGDMGCNLLSCARDGGDPEILNFHEDRG